MSWVLVSTGLISGVAALATATAIRQQRDSMHEQAIHNCAILAKNHDAAEIEFVQCLQMELGKPILNDYGSKTVSMR